MKRAASMVSSGQKWDLGVSPKEFVGQWGLAFQFRRDISERPYTYNHQQAPDGFQEKTENHWVGRSGFDLLSHLIPELMSIRETVRLKLQPTVNNCQISHKRTGLSQPMGWTPGRGTQGLLLSCWLPQSKHHILAEGRVGMWDSASGLGRQLWPWLFSWLCL